MRKLTENEIIALHMKLAEATGGEKGLRNNASLESALNHIFATFDGVDLYPELEEKAARLCYSLINNHPFVDGNKRVGIFSMLVFLELNGVNLSFTQEELVKIGLETAKGNFSHQDILDFIIRHKKKGKHKWNKV